jgi:hypothetical protein
MSPPASAAAAIDDATAAALQRVKVPEAKRVEAVLKAADPVAAKRTFGGVGRDDAGDDGYAQALQATLTAAVRAWLANIVAVCSAEQLLVLPRSTCSVHELKSVIAFAAAANEEATEAALHRVNAAAAYRSEAV